ncbi:FMN-binding protein [Kribbella qitaiheensis]|uniref:FMN-binding protein n=1 Tax=Kribbella qitaiheensis TaxID=1544730 RepID=A0A7G6XAV5_9ACTN|nr:FMN-binding protein [Kribbella qitaiheensis]
MTTGPARSTTPSRSRPPARTPRPAAAQPTKPTPEPTSTPTPKPKPKPKRASVTVNGGLVDTQYGPVQVQLRIRGGRIVAADAIVAPKGDSRTDSINSQAVPQLNQEVVQAQSGRIDTVSGATFTSAGYQSSLQSALDAAHQAGAL